jgi:hypothetical protein
MPRTADQVVAELHALLTTANVSGPMFLSLTRWVACSQGFMAVLIRATSLNSPRWFPARRAIANESDHYIQLEQPDLVIDAVQQVVTEVRDPASWRPDSE